MKASFQATFREKSRHMSFVALCIGLLFFGCANDS